MNLRVAEGTAPGELESLAVNFYHDRHFDIDSVKILPGQYYVTARNMLIVTVLGSCIAACVRDRETGVGGMNHFMLPEGGKDSMVVGTSARYGTYAMELLINHLLKIGARRNKLEAKVFGGGAVLSSLTQAQVGERNSMFVLDYLNTERIPVVAQDLLDIYPRKVYFFPGTGRVLVKKLLRVHNDTIFRREREYTERISHTKVEGEIELFT